MDALDREILSALQDDGRISITDLSARVGLSLSACHRRVRELERAKAIRGYRAILAPDALGLNFEAIVFVTLERSDVTSIGDFEEAVRQLSQVVDAERLFGAPDYMLRVLATDLQAYQELYDRELGSLPGVQKLTSTLVMKRVGPDRTLPL